MNIKEKELSTRQTVKETVGRFPDKPIIFLTYAEALYPLRGLSIQKTLLNHTGD